MKRLTLLVIALVLSFGSAFANNVQISNVTIINNGPGAIQVQFDLKWDNSWRTNVGPANYDGAWVFFKFKAPGGKWEQLFMTGSNNVIPAGFDFYQTKNFMVGAMIYRDASNMGIGSVSITGVKLGVTNVLPYDIDLRGMAIEMVYVPAPTFRPLFGDGDGVNESVNALHYADNTATTGSLALTKCDANSMDDAKLETDGIYVYSNDTLQTTNPISSLDAFPTMKAVWCMKYELSQAGYRDFLNTLDSQQQATRTDAAPTSVRGTTAFTTPVGNFLVIDTPATATKAAVYSCNRNGNGVHNESADGEWDACSNLKWTDLAAFLDWSGLAPMSEIQFERMARGTSSAGANLAVLGEFAWGDTTITNGSYTLTGTGSANELASNASATRGNANYGNAAASAASLRNGIFATSTSNRRTSGASFYGIMELSGNLQEMCICLGNVAGRSCKYVPNGDGRLSALGNAQLNPGGGGFWPGMEGNFSLGVANACVLNCEVTSFAGIRLRGGGNTDAASVLAIADRSVVFQPTSRTGGRGGRGVLNFR
ncbi:MAG: hypothetical protein ABI378_05145 [Chitinophagaceae bacterium]